ncbi:kama family protein [Ophiobolus disseminans]|uniref:Kama family protein n=1 Tax=Ophiobolus disseminans TaxID=1469910 RepID=A0A6A7A8N7_9PLEO|nr:kama family protein [Ophiobolus disseminans]
MTLNRVLRPNLSRATRLTRYGRTLSTFTDGERYWKDTPWKDVPTEEFNSYRWQLRHTVVGKEKLQRFLGEALPDTVGASKDPLLQGILRREDFIDDAVAAFKLAPMAIRLTPHILSRVDWRNPLDDPIRKQFIPLASAIIPDNENATLDSLHEEADSPVPGLVHRYPGRALFLATSICPVYCRFCTRSYAVGEKTETVDKRPQKPSRKRWEVVFQYIESHPELQDIVVSGGDAYYLQPEDLREIGERLLGMDNIQRIRFASKGLAVAPGRIQKGDPWTETLIHLSKQGRDQGKQVCLHTHINHTREITWVTKNAANYLFKHGVIVRNQSVLLKGVNNSYKELSNLIKTLSAINIQPYYVYQCDMVQGVEDLRTPMKEIIELDKHIRGTLSGFMMPSFVVDLPGGGGKRLVSTYEPDSTDLEAGVYRYRAPGLDGEKGEMLYTYFDPKPVKEAELSMLRQQKAEALRSGQTLEQIQATFFNPSHRNSATEVPLEAISQDAGLMQNTHAAESAQESGRKHVDSHTSIGARFSNEWLNDDEVNHNQLAASH